MVCRMNRQSTSLSSSSPCPPPRPNGKDCRWAEEIEGWAHSLVNQRQKIHNQKVVKKKQKRTISDKNKSDKRKLEELKAQVQQGRKLIDTVKEESRLSKLEQDRLTHADTSAEAKAQRKYRMAVEGDKEWDKVVEKWRNRWQRDQQKFDNIETLIKVLGIGLTYQDTLQKFTGIQLLNIEPIMYADCLCLINCSNIDLDNFTVEVLSVEPEFPEAEEFIKEANRRKGIEYTIVMARKYWLDLLTSSSFENSPVSNTRRKSMPLFTKASNLDPAVSLLLFDENEETDFDTSYEK